MDLEKEIKRLIATALSEDLGQGDITSEACIPETARTSGILIMKQSGTLSGLLFLEHIFHSVDPSVTVQLKVEEGSSHIDKIHFHLFLFIFLRPNSFGHPERKQY